MKEKGMRKVNQTYSEFGKSTMSQNSLLNSIIAKLAGLDVEYINIGKTRSN